MRVIGQGIDRRAGDRRTGHDRRRRALRVAEDRRLVAERRRGRRREGLTARLLRYLG